MTTRTIHYHPGDNLVKCDRTGFTVRASECVTEWNGRVVRAQSAEPRQPQDFVRGVRDDQTPKLVRPKWGSTLGTSVSTTYPLVFNGTTFSIGSTAGGRVKITRWEMEITNANVDSGTPINTKFRFAYNATVGPYIDLCTILDIQGAAVGDKFSITGVLSDALQEDASDMTRPFDSPEGTFQVHTSADGDSGGARAKFTLYYHAIDQGATISLSP